MSQQAYYTRCTPRPRTRGERSSECNARVGNVFQIAVAVATGDGGGAAATNNSVNTVAGNGICSETLTNGANGTTTIGVSPLDAANGLDLRISPSGEVFFNGERMELQEVSEGVRTLNIKS